MYTQEQKKLINADKLLEKLSNDVIWHTQWLIVKKAIEELTEPTIILKVPKGTNYRVEEV